MATPAWILDFSINFVTAERLEKLANAVSVAKLHWQEQNDRCLLLTQDSTSLPDEITAANVALDVARANMEKAIENHYTASTSITRMRNLHQAVAAWRG